MLYKIEKLFKALNNLLDIFATNILIKNIPTKIIRGKNICIKAIIMFFNFTKVNSCHALHA